MSIPALAPACRRQRDAGPLIHGLVSLIKIFPGTARLIQPELQQNKIQIPVANYNFTLTGVPPVSRRRAAGVAIHGLVSLRTFFSGTARPFEPELLTSFLL